MATKIQDFLQEKKIDPRRILVASTEIERHRPEDRAIKLAKWIARKSEDAAKKKEGLAGKKPRSGRAVTQRTLTAALVGKPLSGPAKHRILRALNRVLSQKKQEPVEIGAIFEPSPPKPKKPSAESTE
jgi:hypothetical protein